MKKRILSLMLALTMLAGMCAFTPTIVNADSDSAVYEVKVNSWGYVNLTVSGCTSYRVGAGTNDDTIYASGKCRISVPFHGEGDSTAMSVYRLPKGTNVDGFVDYIWDDAERSYVETPIHDIYWDGEHFAELDEGTYGLSISSAGDGVFLVLVVGSGEAPISVFLNDEKLAFDALPVVENGRTLVPVRTIFEAMGMTVGWDGTTSTITATGNGNSISMRINETTATVNDKTLTMDVPPKIVDGRTLVPVRFIAESLGAEVDWDEKNRIVNINTKALNNDRIYTINGIELYGYRGSDGYYVDTSKAFPAFGGYDIKSKDSNLKGSLQIWDSNITNGGKSLKVDYDFTIKHNSYPPYEFDIKLTQNDVSLADSEYKNYFHKNKILLSCYNDILLINVHDLAMITNHTIKNWEFVPDPERNVTIINGKLYSNYTVVRKAQLLYDGVETLGGHEYLMSMIDEYNKCHDGAYEAYSKAGDINKVNNAVGYLTSATISVGSLCAGNTAGVGEIVSAIAPGVSFDVVSNRIEEACDEESDFVYFLLKKTGPNSYAKYINRHTELNRDTMTREQAAEYLTLYYEAKIDNATVLMAFSYFAEKCPEHFPEALLQSAKSAFGPIISALTGDILKEYKISSLANDMAHFLCGTSSTLLDSLESSNNEILVNWAKEVKRLKNELNEALFSDREQTFDIPGRFV